MIRFCHAALPLVLVLAFIASFDATLLAQSKRMFPTITSTKPNDWICIKPNPIDLYRP